MLQQNYRCAIVGSQAQYKCQQLKKKKKKTLVGNFGVVREEIYMKIKVQGCNVSKLKYNDEMWKTIKVQRPQNGFCHYLNLIINIHPCHLLLITAPNLLINSYILFAFLIIHFYHLLLLFIFIIF